MLQSFDYFTLRVFLDGMLFMMACYAICSFWQQKKQIYLLYALYILFLLINLKANDYKHFDTPTEAGDRWAFYLENLSQSFALFFYFWFAADLLLLRQADKISFRLTQVARILLLAEAVIDTFLWLIDLSYAARYKIYLADRYAVGILAVWAIVRLVRGRDKVRILFLTGTSCFLLAALYAVSSPFLPSDHFAGDINRPLSFPLANMQVGVVLEVLFFTLSLSMRNHLTELEKIQYQAQLIEQLQENEHKQAKLNGLRDEIARDLHDEMGSQLSSISILSQTMSRYVSDDHARTRLTMIGETARQVMDSMREIVWSLNSSSDTIQHVGLRIRETAYTLFSESPVQLHVDLTGDTSLHRLTQKQRRELHLIAKECLTNSLRHSHAQNVWLTLLTNSDGLLFTIQDDGKGFNHTDETSGLGLRSVHQRAAQMGAVLSIESEPEIGTTIQLQCVSVVKTAKTTISQQTGSTFATA